MAASTSHGSLVRNPHIIQDTNLYAPTILAGELAVTFFSALMGVVGAAKLMQALARDKLFPGFGVFGRSSKKGDEPFAAVLLTYLMAQLALLADLDQLASLISIFYMVSQIRDSLPISSRDHNWFIREGGSSLVRRTRTAQLNYFLEPIFQAKDPVVYVAS